MISISKLGLGMIRRIPAVIVLPCSILLLSTGCNKDLPRNGKASVVASAYLVEERGSGDEWYYIPVRTIESAELGRFLANPADLRAVSSDGHAADGYYASVVIVKETEQFNSATLWQFANSGDLIMQDRVVMRHGVSGSLEFAFSKEDLGKVPVFVKSARLSEIIRGCVGERTRR